MKLRNFVLFFALLVCFCLLLMPASFAQGWVQQNSGTTNNLNSVYFVNNDTGIVVGDAGTLLRTSNGGAVWTSLNSGTANSLYSVKFLDPNTGIVVGDAGTILKTTDGGISWTGETSGTTANLSSVAFASSTTIVAGTENGSFIRSTDGGTTWDSISSGTTNSISSISFDNANDGLACAPRASNTLLRTSDGGATWTLFNGPISGYKSTSFGTNSFIIVGYVFNYAEYALTTDNGNTWSQKPLNKYGDLLNISAPTTSTWTIIDGVNSEYVIRTTDSGSSWNSQIIGNNFYGIFFSDADNGTIVGYGGTIMHTTDGGATIPPPPALAMPANGTTGVSTSVILEFHPATLFASYGLQVSKDSNFATYVVNLSNLHQANDGNIYDLLSGLDSNTVYYWRANTSNAYGTSAWSQAWHFKTISSYPNLVIYNGTLQSQWEDASWSSTVVYTDTNAIQVSAGAWGAFSVHYGSWGSQGVNPSTYSGLGVSLYGNASVGIEFENDSSQSFPYVLENAGGNSWVDYTIPMSSLNPNGYTISRIDVQSNNSTPVEYYVKNIRLIGGPMARIASNSLGHFAKGLQTENNLPHTFSLAQNYPNPFNPSTVINYSVAKSAHVRLIIYDILGRVVETLVNKNEPQGNYSITFDGSKLSSGVYIYRLIAGSHIFTKKMLMMK